MTDPHLRAFADASDDAALFLDFDGTLSEIVDLPHEAAPIEGAAQILAALAHRLRLVAVVSGRSAHQLLDWLGPDIEIWGIHGAERTRDGRVELSEHAEPFAATMRSVLAEAEAAVESSGLAGIVVEDKGVMIGLHYRAAEDRVAAERFLDDLAERLCDVHRISRAEGKLAFELRPPHLFSKAAVVLERSRETGAKAVGFIGDDVVDLPGFDALDELAGQGVLTVRVAVDSDEAPPELIERADIVTAGPRGVIDLLEELSRLAGG